MLSNAVTRLVHKLRESLQFSCLFFSSSVQLKGRTNGAQRVRPTKPCNFTISDLERIRETHPCTSGRSGVEVGILQLPLHSCSSRRSGACSNRCRREAVSGKSCLPVLFYRTQGFSAWISQASRLHKCLSLQLNRIWHSHPPTCSSECEWCHRRRNLSCERCRTDSPAKLSKTPSCQGYPGWH